MVASFLRLVPLAALPSVTFSGGTPLSWASRTMIYRRVRSASETAMLSAFPNTMPLSMSLNLEYRNPGSSCPSSSPTRNRCSPGPFAWSASRSPRMKAVCGASGSFWMSFCLLASNLSPVRSGLKRKALAQGCAACRVAAFILMIAPCSSERSPCISSIFMSLGVSVLLNAGKG
ncbi:hypothetical protein B484DRAFT_441656 [Ochromonadaceae sp. CCMP2298]|nr:hypothetical protein B484DRAFT_441656 [Ochromonadaceae sp. CCMP2298]